MVERRCGDAELARDICQETFAVLIPKFRREKIADPEKLGSYIQQTAVNLFIASKRKDARRQTYADSEFIDTYVDGSVDGAIGVLAGGDGFADPLSELEKMQIRKEVRESIQSLKNNRDVEVLYRYYILELEKEDICQQLDIDFRHFDKVISRARGRLRHLLDREGSLDTDDSDGTDE